MDRKLTGDVPAKQGRPSTKSYTFSDESRLAARIKIKQKMRAYTNKCHDPRTGNHGSMASLAEEMVERTGRLVKPHTLRAMKHLGNQVNDITLNAVLEGIAKVEDWRGITL